jgi:hypothetical protein
MKPTLKASQKGEYTWLLTLMCFLVFSFLMCCNRYHLFRYADLGSELRCTVFLFANKLPSPSSSSSSSFKVQAFRRCFESHCWPNHPLRSLDICCSPVPVLLFGSLLSSIFSMWTVYCFLYFPILPTTLTTPSCSLMVSLQILTHFQIEAYHLMG